MLQLDRYMFYIDTYFFSDMEMHSSKQVKKDTTF